MPLVNFSETFAVDGAIVENANRWSEAGFLRASCAGRNNART